MNNETKDPPPSLVTPDDAIDLISEITPLSITTTQFDQNQKHKSKMLFTSKMQIQQRLMRWCAFILSLGTIIIVWRYISILILAVWLSSICRPFLEWLVNHL